MSQPLGIISLKCPNCGAGISVTPELDVFACGYCGAQQMVQRGGGIASLKLIGEAIARVQHGTDRTAAELAIRRLREELTTLEVEKKQIAWVISAGNLTVGTLGLAVIVLLPIGVRQFNESQYMEAVVAVSFAVFFAACAVKKGKTRWLLESHLTKKLAIREADIRRELEQHFGTVAK
jgi:hypothetical protein